MTHRRFHFSFFKTAHSADLQIFVFKLLLACLLTSLSGCQKEVKPVTKDFRIAMGQYIRAQTPALPPKTLKRWDQEISLMELTKCQGKVPEFTCEFTGVFKNARQVTLIKTSSGWSIKNPAPAANTTKTK